MSGKIGTGKSKGKLNVKKQTAKMKELNKVNNNSPF